MANMYYNKRPAEAKIEVKKKGQNAKTRDSMYLLKWHKPGKRPQKGDKTPIPRETKFLINLTGNFIKKKYENKP